MRFIVREKNVLRAVSVLPRHFQIKYFLKIRFVRVQRLFLDGLCSKPKEFY